MGSARLRFPVQEVRCLCALTQGRAQVRMEQPGQRYFHGFKPHSSQREGALGLGFGVVSSSGIGDGERESRGEEARLWWGFSGSSSRALHLSGLALSLFSPSKKFLLT